MKSKVSIVFMALSAAVLCGCAQYDPPLIHLSGAPVASLKTAYVVLSTNQDPDIGKDIQEALTKHAVQVQAGPMDKRPKDVDFYVDYEDHWQWDLSMYLTSLQIEFKNSADGQLIASGIFQAQMGLHHGWPDRREKTFEIIDAIYNAK